MIAEVSNYKQPDEKQAKKWPNNGNKFEPNLQINPDMVVQQPRKA